MITAGTKEPSGTRERKEQYEIFIQRRNHKHQCRKEQQFRQVHLFRQQKQEKDQEEGKIMQSVTKKEAYERYMNGETVLAVMSAVPLGALDLDTFRDSGEMIFLAGGEASERKTEEKAAAPQEDAEKDAEEEEMEKSEGVNEETLRKLYVKWRWSAKRIADKYNMDVSKVFRLLKQYGIARKAGPDDPVDRSRTLEKVIR